MKNEENDVLKMLALQAKLRMKNGVYRSRTKGNSPSFVSPQSQKKYLSTFCADYKLMALSTKEDDEIIDKIKTLLESEQEVVNPIKHIINNSKFEKMDDVEKMRYVLGVSHKYRDYVEKYQKDII